MEKLGSIELVADKDVKEGEGISIDSLFSYAERRKEFELPLELKRWKTKIKVDVPKICILETTADTTRKKEEKASLMALLSYPDREKDFTASEEVKEGDKLSLSIETM